MLQSKHGNSFVLGLDHEALAFFAKIVNSIFNYTSCKPAQSVFFEKFGKNFKKAEDYVDEVVKDVPKN